MLHVPQIFWKLPENQITTNFIYLTSSNFFTISHINYWDQVNSRKSLWKLWNGPLCRNKLGPSPLLNIIGRVATPKLVPRNSLRYLKTALIMGGGGLVSEFMWGIVGSSVIQTGKKIKIPRIQTICYKQFWCKPQNQQIHVNNQLS